MPSSPDLTRLQSLSPVYWPSWCGIAILRVVELLPYRAIMAFGRGLGFAARNLVPRYRRVARRNLDLCFPAMSSAKREQLLVQQFDALGQAVCESAMSWWSSDERIRGLSSIVGAEHLDEALKRGHGVILLTAHFTTLEISARILCASRPVCILYKPVRSAVLAAVSNRARARRAGSAVRYDDIRSMISALRRNEIVWYAPDQSFRKKGAQMVPFFGIPAASNVHTSRLAELTGATVLYMSHERLPEARGYRLTIHPPFAHYPSGDAVTDVRQLHHCIEEDASRIPAQYWWIHRRFKGLSADYPNYYAEGAVQLAAP
jgi:KDO2-lipid IV(A) lauroyltransferase